MMFEYCGVYNQGALFYREDFDVLKTIRYFCDMYRINLDDEIVHEIKNNDITDEHFAFLCNELEVNMKKSDIYCFGGMHRKFLKIDKKTIKFNKGLQIVGSFEVVLYIHGRIYKVENKKGVVKQ